MASNSTRACLALMPVDPDVKTMAASCATGISGTIQGSSPLGRSRDNGPGGGRDRRRVVRQADGVRRELASCPITWACASTATADTARDEAGCETHGEAVSIGHTFNTGGRRAKLCANRPRRTKNVGGDGEAGAVCR